MLLIQKVKMNFCYNRRCYFTAFFNWCDGNTANEHAFFRKKKEHQLNYTPFGLDGPIISDGTIQQSNCSAVTYPEAIALSFNVVPFLCADLAIALALS